MRAYVPKVLTASVLASAFACAGATKLAELEKAPVGAQVIVERSQPSRPDWVLDPPTGEGGAMFFFGGETGYTDRGLCARMARAEALEEMGQSVMSVWSSLLQASGTGGNELFDQYARDFQELAVEQVGLSGAQTEERYSEKVAVKTGYGVEYRYNAFVLLEVPVRDYDMAQVRALQELEKRARANGDSEVERFIAEAIRRLNETRG